MKYPILLAMSILSLLFGCNPKKTPPKAEEWPRFPETDNPYIKIEPVQLDSGFLARSFFIQQDKQHVYVLGYKKDARRNPDDPSERETSDFRLYAIDTEGRPKRHLNLMRIDRYWGGSFGMLDNQLMIRLGDYFLVLDIAKFTIQEKISVYDKQFFPSKQKVELMTFDEQRDAYQALFDEMLEKCTGCKWLDWTPGGEYLVFVPGPAGKRSAWSPMSYEDELLADLKSRFELISVPLNPQTNNTQDGSEMYISDAGAKIREAEYLSGGTELDYPNYKNRSVLQYEMTLGDKKLHFSTTDKKRHDLRLRFSDNAMLSTADGAAWVTYEGVLYRIESALK